MKHFILPLILLLTTAQAHAQQAQPDAESTDYKYAQPAIPSHFNSKIEEYLFYDNNFNVVQRLRDEDKAKAKANLMSDADKAPAVIYLFEADISKLGSSLAVSKFIENSDLSRVRNSNGKILIPCLESDRIGYQALRLKFGEPVHKTTGRKVLSRATYYVEPVGSTGGFFAKFVPHVPGLEQKLEREILVNDYVKSQLSELPIEMRNLSMDSFMAVNLSVLGVPVSVAYRSADKVIADKGVNVKTFPGHGLLGCDSCVLEYARKFAGTDIDDSKAIDRWKTRELLPKLAKYMAYANHVLGVSFEAHTQNMIFDIDTNTGKIKDIYFRDFADVLLNPIPLLAANKLPKNIDWNRVKLMSVHGNYFSDQAVSIAKDIWYHSSIYSGQGITSHITGFQKQQRHLRVFLESYIAETSVIMDQPVELSEDAKKVMLGLEQKISKEQFYSGELQERSPLRNAMASVLKPIFEQVFKVKNEKINNELNLAVISGDQKRLSKAFYKMMISQRVVFTTDEAKTNLVGKDTKYTWLKNTLNAYLKLGLSTKKIDSTVVFKFHDGRLWAIDSLSNKVLAATIETFDLQPRLLEKMISAGKSLLRMNKVIQCKALF